MSTLVLEQNQYVLQPADEYPATDGQPMAETEIHLLAMLHLIGALRYFFRQRKDIYVIGNMLFYYRKGDPRARRAPDVMVVKGIDATVRRRSYKLWEEGVPPCFVVEVTSKATQDEDTINKASLYTALGVREYFLFDPLHEYLNEQLQGYRLVDAGYEPIPLNEDGDLYSEELDLVFSVKDSLLRIVDPKTGQYIPSLEEAAEIAIHEAQRAEHEAERAEHEAQRAEHETQRAAQETQRAEQAAQRAAAAEAEVARLRALLNQAGQQRPE
jgi:Uma2 family endonuclease